MTPIRHLVRPVTLIQDAAGVAALVTLLVAGLHLPALL